MGSDSDTIYIQLFDEGTTTWRPTLGVPLGNELYQVLATPRYEFADEVWEFLPGSVVRCVVEVRDGESYLFARELVSAPPGT